MQNFILNLIKKFLSFVCRVKDFFDKFESYLQEHRIIKFLFNLLFFIVRYSVYLYAVSCVIITASELSTIDLKNLAVVLVGSSIISWLTMFLLFDPYKSDNQAPHEEGNGMGRTKR